MMIFEKLLFINIFIIMKNNVVNTELYRHKSEQGTVTLKSRKNGNNPISLYLEIYGKATQKRHLQFLNLYLTGNEITDTQIKTDALRICTGYTFNIKNTDTSFTDFIQEQILRIDKVQSRKNPICALKKLVQFAGIDNIPFNKVNERFLLSFREWLLNRAVGNIGKRPLDKGTCDLYFSIVMRFSNRAQKKGLIPITAYQQSDIPAIGKVVKVPVTFTEDEIIRLQNTPYPATEICKALMLQFACGQRWGDVKCMTWEQIALEDEVYKLVLQQEKTDKILPSFITRALMDWIGEDKERKSLIFKALPKYDQTVRNHLQRWCTLAGIEKKVGTHTMRRSCATILYKKGVPLFTISKILGHSKTDITLRYIGLDEGDIRKGLDALKDITQNFSYSKAS